MLHRLALAATPAPRAGLCLGLLLWIAGSALAGTPAPTPIAWRGTFADARKEARATGRPIWLQFTGHWCGYCRQMERESFTRAEVIALARQKFVPVQAQADEDEALAQQFGITSVPATLLLKPGGEVIARHDGYADPETFLALLGRVPAGNPQAARDRDRDRDRDGVALAGYCPVRLVQDGRLEAGRPALALRHEGRQYWFADASTRDAFQKEPEAYLPADGGFCPVHRLDRGTAVAGDPGRGVLYRGRLYLCADEPARAAFAADPERYANFDVADRGFCPHCRARHGEPVRGLPRFTVTHAGQRYFFPAKEHLEAFRADPETFLR